MVQLVTKGMRMWCLRAQRILSLVEPIPVVRLIQLLRTIMYQMMVMSRTLCSRLTSKRSMLRLTMVMNLLP